MSNWVNVLVVVHVAWFAVSLSAQSVEIVGQIAAIDEQGVAMVVSGDSEPQLENKFNVVVEVPGVGQATIAQGEVTAIDGDVVLGKIIAATGKVSVGQIVKIDSPNAVRKRAVPTLPDPIVGKVGAVQEKEITIVIASSIDPTIGAQVEVFAEVAGLGRSSIGRGQVTAVQPGLITASIEQISGTLSFGQEVQIYPTTTSSDGSASGEFFGMKLDPVDATIAELLDLPKVAGMVVRSVTKGSPAENAGLKKRDVLLQADGIDLNDLATIQSAIEKARGDLKIEFWRDGAAQTLTLPPTESTVNAAANSVEIASTPGWIGLEIENYRHDVRVKSVVPGSPAARAGFRPGDQLGTLDGEKVIFHHEFVHSVSSGTPGKKRRIELTRGNEQLLIELLPEPRPTLEQLFAQMNQLAEGGNHDAQYQLALMYFRGQGLPEPDAVAARRWMRAAAEGNLPLAQTSYGEYLFHGIGGETNFNEGFVWTKKAADQGWSSAYLSLGRNYLNGYGVDKNEAEARRWFSRALESGSLQSMIYVGDLYSRGELFEKNPEKTVELFRAAADRGDVVAQRELGRCLIHGLGIAKDPDAGFELVRQAAELGEPTAMWLLGVCYKNGEGVIANDTEAHRWYLAAADLGQEEAFLSLGNMYAEGQGVPQDDELAVAWFLKGAEVGHADAQYNLGIMYTNGRGVPVNDEQAVTWFRKAAEAGHAFGQYNLAVMYASGRGVAKDDREALKWFQKSADQKYASAEHELGVIAMEGRGAKKDLNIAIGWFKFAAKHGEAKSQHQLGVLYETGQGVPRNLTEAIKSYEQAAAQDYSLSIEALKRLGRR